MLICTGSSVSRLSPFAVTSVKLTGPKLVSGRTLEVPEVPDGASAMASADRSAPAAVALIVWIQAYPERISYTCRSDEFFIVAIRPAIRA